MAKLLDLEPQRRDAVLNAALKEFSLQGYDNASTNVIAKEAGISKALMFHYVGSKQELFLTVYDYFSGLMKREYFDLMNYAEKDIFERLRQSYHLQMNLLVQYPWILEFSQLSRAVSSSKENQELADRMPVPHSNCYSTLFDNIDESKFRPGLNIDRCKQIIYWSNVGFTNQLLDTIRETNTLNCEYNIKKLDEYLDELKKIFYPSDNE